MFVFYQQTAELATYDNSTSLRDGTGISLRDETLANEQTLISCSEDAFMIFDRIDQILCSLS